MWAARGSWCALERNGTLTAAAAQLESGELALSEGRWEEARGSFEAALAVEQTPEAHEGLAWAATWVNDGDRAIAAFDGAHRLYLERGDRRGAARVAGWLAWCYGSFRGQLAVAGGWVETARRLLEGLEPGPEHAWLAPFGGMKALRGGDTAAAIRLAREAAEIARAAARPDLEAMGLALEGEALVAEEVAVSEVALDDDQRNAFAGHLDGVGVPELAGAKRRRTPAAAAVRRSSARAAAGDQCRPRVAPLMTHSSGPTGKRRPTATSASRSTSARTASAPSRAALKQRVHARAHSDLGYESGVNTQPTARRSRRSSSASAPRSPSPRSRSHRASVGVDGDPGFRNGAGHAAELPAADRGILS